MAIYLPIAGVNTKQKTVYASMEGVNTKMKTGYALINGVNTKVYSSFYANASLTSSGSAYISKTINSDGSGKFYTHNGADSSKTVNFRLTLTFDEAITSIAGEEIFKIIFSNPATVTGATAEWYLIVDGDSWYGHRGSIGNGYTLISQSNYKTTMNVTTIQFIILVDLNKWSSRVDPVFSTELLSGGLYVFGKPLANLIID